TNGARDALGGSRPPISPSPCSAGYRISFRLAGSLPGRCQMRPGIFFDAGGRSCATERTMEPIPQMRFGDVRRWLEVRCMTTNLGPRFVGGAFFRTRVGDRADGDTFRWQTDAFLISSERLLSIVPSREHRTPPDQNPPTGFCFVAVSRETEHVV